MHLADTLLAVVALSSLGLWPADRPAAKPIEVVFTTARPATFCDGCHKTVTDSLANQPNPTYTCPNGDSWTLIMGTPTSASGDCAFAIDVCLPKKACTFTRSGTLTFVDLPNNGSCNIYYREDTTTGPYQAGSNQQVFAANLSAACVAGSPADSVCDEYFVEFFDTGGDSPTKVFEWRTKVCCNKCPD